MVVRKRGVGVRKREEKRGQGRERGMGSVGWGDHLTPSMHSSGYFLESADKESLVT